MNKRQLLLTGILATVGIGSAHAERVGIYSHESARMSREALARMEQGDFDSFGDAARQLIETSLQVLENYAPIEAAELRGEWEQFSFMLSAPGAYSLFGLGDHAPLSPWLAKLTKSVKSRVPRFLHDALRLNDLDILNYAPPVVFNPRGFRGQTWTKSDYREHFVPLGGLIVYWSGMVACKKLAPTAARKACGPGVRSARWAAEKVALPLISDSTYDRANRRRS